MTRADGPTGRAVPYFSQYETPDVVNRIAAEGVAAALAADPLWAASGAHGLDEYVAWADHVCGMACLKMIIAARTGRAVPILELARLATERGAYALAPDGTIRGMIYAPIVPMLAERLGIEAQVVTGVDTAALPEVLARADMLIASVHCGIVTPERDPPHKGGHLVLVLTADREGVVFHDPSGRDRATREHVRLALADFDRFFAGRGIAILPERPSNR